MSTRTANSRDHYAESALITSLLALLRRWAGEDGCVVSFDVVEAGIAELRGALETGRLTSVGLVDAYLARIDAFDRHGPQLNSVVVMNPHAREQALVSDERRSRGEPLGSLEGIPYTAKDSYLATGLTAAAGSHAFEHLVAQRDAFTIERLRASGAILIGLTNMPADGQWRHAARPLRPGRKPLQRRLSDVGVRLGFLERFRHGDRRELRRFRARRGNLVERAGAGGQQRAVSPTPRRAE